MNIIDRFRIWKIKRRAEKERVQLNKEIEGARQKLTQIKAGTK
jgi:hypothetical protein